MKKLAALALVVLAACGGDDDDDVAAKRDADRTTSSSTATTAASPTSTEVATGDPATTTPVGAGGAPSPTTTPAASASTNDGPAPLAAGTYRYRQTGSASAAGQTYSSPPEGTLVADAPDGAGMQVLHRYVDPKGEPTDVHMRFGADGMFMTKTILRQGGQEIECVFDPPLPSPAWPPMVGAEFSGHADCDQITTDVRSKITGTKDVTLDGAAHRAFVIESTITTSGAVASTSHNVDWFVPELRLNAHTESTSQGTFGEIAFTAKSTGDLLSAIPA